uniref:Minor capsid protein P9 transmembrane helices domain-containing protein n=1 Tax=viral metagenome TaxID=1070528 RepID=A0A6C0EZR6_9ZZZZ
MTTPATNITLTQTPYNTGSSNISLSPNNENGNSDNVDSNKNKSSGAYKVDDTKYTQFWINQPSVLLDKNDMTDFWPMPLMSVEQKLNAITRLVLLLTILGFLITTNINIIFTGFITLAIFVMLYKTQYNLNTSSASSVSSASSDADPSAKKEGFVNSQMYNALKPHLTTPTIQNPMMNVLLPEISYNPTRDEAAPSYNSEVEKEINHSTEGNVVLNFEPRNLTEAEKLRKKLFADLGDKYEFDDSMRMFYTNPSTTIPNDQKGFAEFCFGDMISCKQGNEMACQRFNPRLGGVIN